MALVLVAAARPLEAHLVELRSRGPAGRSLASFTPRRGRPAVEAISTACLGGLRGIIADLLWMRAIRMEEEGRTYEIVALLDGILRMQPRFVSVWVYQARVLVFDYGSALENPSPEEAYRWIKRGTEVLEEGAEQNPNSYKLHFVLADVYLRKFSKRNVDRKTWIVLVRKLHEDVNAEEIRRARAEGRPPPPVDPYLGLKRAKRHYLIATEKPDISPARKLLCRRLAIRCLAHMGHWRQAEEGWRQLLESLSQSEKFGPGTPGYKLNLSFFRQFMRHRVARLLEGGRESESREVHTRMRKYFKDCPDYRGIIVEEIRGLRLMRLEQRARAVHRVLREKLGDPRTYEEVIGAPAGTGSGAGSKNTGEEGRTDG
jgi:hypothetical protein